MFSSFLKRVSPQFLPLSIIIILLVSISTFGQAVSGVTGVVTDPNGAIVAGATVVLTDTKTGRELTTTSNENGSYTFQNVQPGQQYKLTVTKQGFQTLVLSGLTLGVAKTETYDATLTAGDVSATVDVVATSAGDTLNTTDASIGNVIDTRQLRELPIQIRSSPAVLIGLQPGVVGNNVGTTSTNRVGAVTGARADQNNITVDGIDANDQTTGQFGATIGNAPIDAIQEFRAVSTNPSASEGRSAGGQIQIVTKSGTNEFHGSLREYNRNDYFGANTFFNNRSGVERARLNRNQFGGSIGGPVPMLLFGERPRTDPWFRSGKDKLFFFFDYEGRRDASGFVNTPRIVPLEHVRNGQIGYINNNPGCTSESRLDTQPNCISFLSTAQVQALDPAGIGVNQALLTFMNSRYPAANDLSLGDGINTGGLRFNSPVHRADNTYTTRFDANVTERQKVFVRFNIARRVQTDIVNSVPAQFPGDPEPSQIRIRDWSVAAGHSWAITNNFFNQFTIGNTHGVADFPTLFAPASPQSWTFGLVTNPYAGISSQNRTVDTPTIRNDSTWTRGNHVFFFGGQWKPIKQASGIVNDFNFVGVGLGSNLTALDASVQPANILQDPDALDLYDQAFAFALGRISTVATNFNYSPTGDPLPLTTGKQREFRYNEYEFYVQDNWKIRPDFTLNLGLRWQYYEPPYEANGFQAANNLDWEEIFALRQANAAAGIGGDAAEPFITYDLIGKANGGRPFYEPDWNNFAPRIGFAWTPTFADGFGRRIFGDRKTVIRGGASLQYERVGGALTFIQDQNTYLFDNSATTDTPGDLATDVRFGSINTTPIVNTPPVITRPFTPFVTNGSPEGWNQTNYVMAQNFQIPYSYQYSIGFQRELPGDMLLDVSYVGRQGRKLLTQVDTSQVLNFKDPASGQFMLDAFNAIQAQVQAGLPSSQVTVQPWLENQGALALGMPCTAALGVTCTRLFAGNATLRNYMRIGDTSDMLALAQQAGILRNNVGLSSQFASNVVVNNEGRSRYDGLLISLQKRFSRGLQFDVNYTYSHAKDNNSSVANSTTGGLIWDLRDTNLGYGPSDFDIRHIVNINGIWELPFGNGKWIGGGANGFVDRLIGGWQLSGIFTYRSGLPFSPGVSTAGTYPVSFLLASPAVFIGNENDIRGQIDATGTNITFFPDKAAALAAFRLPQHGESGTRNILRGPNFWNLDMGIAKNFKMPWEGHRIQFRMDAFNVLNTNHFGLPNVNITSGSFGNITTSASTPREIQFALRYDF
jgi:hypothetical protein